MTIDFSGRQRGLRGLLLRFLLRSAARARDRLPADDHFDVESLAVFGAFGDDEPVVRQAAAGGLHPFLQRRLPVFGEAGLGRAIAGGATSGSNRDRMNSRAASMPPSR